MSSFRCLKLLAVLGLTILFLDVAQASSPGNKVEVLIEEKNLQVAEKAEEKDLIERYLQDEVVDKMEKRNPEDVVKDDEAEKEDQEIEEDEVVVEKREEAEQESKEVKEEKEDQEETEVEEKRDEAENEAEEVENLEKRSVRFSLVNRYGHRISHTSRSEGLLLNNGGTVCDDYFSMNSAHAVCRRMGFSRAVSWRHGLLYGSMQSRKRITMDDVRCRATYWNYCSYRSSHNCGHHEDVFLTCQPYYHVVRASSYSSRPRFTLVDWMGRTTRRGSEGLLLSNGGTVCDDYFTMNAAHAICKQLGYRRGAVRYRHGLAYGTMQTRKRITLDDVRCSSTSWSSCHYSTSRHNCVHSEDVMLTCRA